MIEIQEISKWYGDFQVLTDCSTRVEKGEAVMVCGPTGAGKSTLIKCVNGLEPFLLGDIVIDGISLSDRRISLPRMRSRIGMVFQHCELFPHMTIAENMTIAQEKVLGRGKQEALAKAGGLLDRVGLIAHAHRYPGELSGGQQQRAAIARALAMDPLCMLFDEPTSELGPEMADEVLGVIAELARDGMTMMCVTQEMGFVRDVADRVVFMDRGRIVEDVTKEDFFSNPRSESARDFLAKI